MKLWVPPWRVPPPSGETILAKYGASLCFVSYSRALDRWKLVANGTEEIVEAPPRWLCSGEYAAEHEIKGARPPAPLEKPIVSRRRRKGSQQLSLLE